MLTTFRRVLFTVWVAVGLLGFGQAAGAAPPNVSNILLAEQGGGTRVVIELSQRAEYRLFFLAEPMRAVIDLPPVAWNVGGNAARPRGLVAGFRYGQFDPKTARLVLDLAAPAKVRTARYDLPSGGRHRLIIDLEPSSTADFEAQIQPWGPSVTRVAGLSSAAVNAVLPGAASPAPANPTLSLKAPEPPAAVAQPTPPVRTAVAPLPPVARPPARKDVKRVVVIDPGHGGVDPGAVGATGTFEKDVTLAVARELKRQLEGTGRYKVVMTRDDDTFIRLRDRIAVARAANAELFVSVHADSMRNRETRGASIYTLSENASDDEAAGLAARENRADIIAGVDLSHENKMVASILIDLAQRETMNHSASFAGILVSELDKDVQLVPLRPHRFAGFAVLKAPDVPSVLIELGYLSNKNDEQLLMRPHYRGKLGNAIVRGIDRYFQKRPPNG